MMNKAETVFEKLALSPELLINAGQKASKISTKLLLDSVKNTNLKQNKFLFNKGMKKAKQARLFINEANRVYNRSLNKLIKEI